MMAPKNVKMVKPTPKLNAETLQRKICQVASDIQETQGVLKDYRTELTQLLKIFRQHGGE